MKLPQIGTRKLIACTFVYTYVYMLIKGIPVSDQFIGILCLVTGYYFGKSTALDIPGAEKKGESDD